MTYLRTFVTTFVVAWLGLAFLFACWGTYAHSVRPGADNLVEAFAVGLGFGLVYAFWPAVLAAGCRTVFRAVGWAAFVPLPVVVLGVVGMLWATGGWLVKLLVGILDHADIGMCAHTGAGPLILFCLSVAILFSPAAWLATAQVLAAVVLVLMLGSLPGCVLWVVLVLRALRRRRATPA